MNKKVDLGYFFNSGIAMLRFVDYAAPFACNVRYNRIYTIYMRDRERERDAKDDEQNMSKYISTDDPDKN